LATPCMRAAASFTIPNSSSMGLSILSSLSEKDASGMPAQTAPVQGARVRHHEACASVAAG
jgi:hypothetical protein